MAIVDKLLHRAFGLPTGFLGRIGGKVMAGERQRTIARNVADRLGVRPGDKVLEIGFGPGVGIEHVHERLSGSGLIVGVDPSDVMLEMAKSRNAAAVERGTAALLKGSVSQIPYGDAFFDKAYAMNSFHLWPDQEAGLREVRRVLRPGGRLVLSFYGPALKAIKPESVREMLEKAGFAEIADATGSDGVLYVEARRQGTW